MYRHIVLEFLLTLLFSPNASVNNSCFSILPTSWFRFYLLLTSSLLDMFTGVPESPIPSLLLWISPVLEPSSSCPSLLIVLSFSALPRAPLCSPPFWFFVQMTSGSPTLSPDFHGCPEVTSVPTFCSIVLGLHVCLPSQTLCPLWAGILPYQLLQHLGTEWNALWSSNKCLCN